MSTSRVQNLRVAAVLEDCSHQLDILGHTLTLQIRREGGAASALEKARLTELSKVCQHVSQQMSTLHVELEKQSCSSLEQFVEEVERRKEAEELKRQQETELATRKQTELRKQEELKLREEELDELKLLHKHLEIKVENKSQAVRNQRSAEELKMQERQQQMERDRCKAEELLQDQLKLLQKHLENKKRVHVESMKFLQNRHEELEQQLDKWQQLTKQMLEEKRTALNNVCCKKTLNFDRLMEMRRKFREMQQVVIEGREEQEKLQQQQAEVRAAIKLQVWWRDCMVHRGLGSFRKPEEGKKGKKKKEGKKKKKK